MMKISIFNLKNNKMRVTKIGCSGTFLIGTSNFKKYWMEGELSEGEDEMVALSELNSKIEQANEKFNPEIDKFSSPYKKTSPEAIISLSEEEELIKAINACTEINGENGLLSYRIPASLDASTKSAYDLRMMQLKGK